MKNIIEILNEVISKIPKEVKLGLFIFPLALCAVYLVLLLVCLFSKKARFSDKTFSLYLCLLSVCLYPFAEIKRLDKNWFFLFAAASIFLSGLLYLTSKGKSRLTAREKRLIGRLSANIGADDRRPSAIKRTEYLRPDDAFSSSEEIDPNLSGIKKAIISLKRRELSEQEKKEIEKIEIDVEKFSFRKPTPYERAIFSDEMMKIVKLCSKYCI